MFRLTGVCLDLERSKANWMCHSLAITLLLDEVYKVEVLCFHRDDNLTASRLASPYPPTQINSTSNTMSSSGNAADSVDTFPGSSQPHGLTGEPNTTRGAAQIGHDFTRESHRLKKTNKNLISVDNLTDKQIEIVAKLNEHSNLLVNIILLSAVIFVAWGMYEMGIWGASTHLPSVFEIDRCWKTMGDAGHFAARHKVIWIA